MEMFNGVNNVVTKTCRICREDNKKRDATRDKEHRNALARVAERKPERIAVKNAWKEENYEKVAETWQKSRNNRLVTVGEEEFLKRNAEDAQRWRDNNPEKVAENNKTRKENIDIHYSNYQRTAGNKNLQFEFTIDEFKELVKMPCHYCGVIQDHGFNGIDRMNQQNGYITDNCVSCCQMCNYVKKSLYIDTFLKRIEHILHINNHISNGREYPELFRNYYEGINYSKYKYRANKKQIIFNINEKEFNELTQQNCYICGKLSSINHINGVDRFDNNVGYLLDNCRPCCGECNYMKNNYNYDDLFTKFIQIYNHRILTDKHEFDLFSNSSGDFVAYQVSSEEAFSPLSKELLSNEEKIQPELKNIVYSNDDVRIMTKSNKKNKAEMTECARLRKQEQRERMKERMGDEDYRKLRAKEIATNRANKKCIVQDAL